MERRKKRPKRSPLRAKRLASRRREIIRAAVKVFAEVGFHSATMDDIARELGATKGLLYHYFRSKEEILEAILHDEELLAQLEAPLVPVDAPLAKAIESSIDRSFTLFRSNAQLVRVLYLQSIMPEKKAELAFRQMLERLYDRAGRWLDHFKQNGEIRPEVDSRLWGELLVDAFTNVILKSGSSTDPGDMPLDSLKATLEILFHGVTTEKGRAAS